LLETDKNYNKLVEMIRIEYGDSLNDNENIVTMYLNEENQLEKFSSDDGMKIAVQRQMDINKNNIFVFKVYTGRTADQQSDENMHGYFFVMNYKYSSYLQLSKHFSAKL
jgi:hypothetical protein